ncbi:MAG: sodium:proton antiporter, partial [Planctomycetota bacterium]
NTYIGNGPNFMVRAIAEARGYDMPGFITYMAIALMTLGPVFLLATMILFAG